MHILSNTLRIFLILILMNVQNAFALSLDQKIDKFFAPFSNWFSNIVFTPVTIAGVDVPVLILFLIIASIIFTIYLRGVNLWGFTYAFKAMSVKSSDDTSDGEVSPLQSLFAVLSGTIGLGSIAGVAIAISVGGPGAIFWLCFGAFFGMVSKFLECTLAVKYRRFNPDGTISGGPMHYIAHGLTRKGMRKLGQALAIFFALMCIPGSLGGGNMLQINQAVQQVIYITGGEKSFFYHNAWVCGLVAAIVTALIIIGGIKSIAKFATKVVPLRCGIYILAALAVIIANISHLPYVFYSIIHEAFAPQAVTGGVIGCIILGMRRSIQTNEAGAGSAPIAYATAKTKEPISQGFVSLLEPFFTAIMCLVTAFVIIITGKHLEYTQGVTGIELTSSAFATLSPFLPYVLAVVVILFAFTTMITWSYYGQKAWNYLLGEGKKRTLAFQIIFCIVIVIGSSMNLKSIIDFTDATMLAMAAPNLIAIFILMPDIKRDLADYCRRFKVKNWITKV